MFIDVDFLDFFSGGGKRGEMNLRFITGGLAVMEPIGLINSYHENVSTLYESHSSRTSSVTDPFFQKLYHIFELPSPK